MFARLLLLAAVFAPLYAQDDEVTRFLEELRAPKTPRDVQAEQRELLASTALQLDRATDPAQKAALYLQISDVEQSLGESEAAIAAARNAHDLQPGDEKVSLGLAQVLLDNRQTAEIPALLGVDPADGAALIRKASALSSTALAAFCAELAHDLLPDDPKVADTLGSIYTREGASDKAVAAFRQAVDREPHVATYRYHLAVAAYAKYGNRDQARAEFLLALQSNPSETERANIEITLARMDAPLK